jgi:hypothetical protein
VVPEILALQRRCLYGGHEILVQKTSLIHRMQYGLIIDGVKQDQIDALAGTFALHGAIREGKSVIPVKVVVKQGFFTGTYHCVIDGVARRMERYRHEIP